MATVEAGSALTCGHEGCGCQVRIDAVCNCSGGGDSYVCICGGEHHDAQTCERPTEAAVLVGLGGDHAEERTHGGCEGHHAVEAEGGLGVLPHPSWRRPERHQ